MRLRALSIDGTVESSLVAAESWVFPKQGCAQNLFGDIVIQPAKSMLWPGFYLKALVLNHIAATPHLEQHPYLQVIMTLRV